MVKFAKASTSLHGLRNETVISSAATLVMASAARPSIVEVRGNGLPRFARSDKNFSA
jgi:hypothetical protein